MLRMDDSHGESGMGLVEVMVAMVLFAIILTAAAPLLVNSLRQAGDNVSTAAAAKLANEQITLAKDATSSCDAFEAFVNAPHATINMGRNTFVVMRDSQILEPGEKAACLDTSHPTMWFEVTVARSAAPSKPVVTTRTIVAVPGLS